MAGSWGGPRPNSGRKRKPLEVVGGTDIEPKPAKVAAEPKAPVFNVEAMRRLIELSVQSKRALDASEIQRLNPYQLPTFPKQAIPPSGGMAMDQFPGFEAAQTAWAGAALMGTAQEGMLFLGYPYLSELAQRTEYRTISEIIADDSTRRWIDFEVVGTPDEEAEAERKDPEGYAERKADPDERKKKLESRGKLDKVKAIKDDQERLDAKTHIYNLVRNDGFFGRSHLLLQIAGANLEPGNPELKTDIGDGRNRISRSKVGRGRKLTGLKVIEPLWTYPQAYNATNPLLPGWYEPLQWYVMGTEVHASRLLPFIGRPVPDMLKPAYSFGGLSLSQIVKPYVDIWLTTRASVGQLIHSFSVMVLQTDMSTILQPGGSIEGVMQRVALFNAFRDNQGTFVLNKMTEDFKNVSAPISGLSDLQAQAQEHICSAARIPVVKFTGISPKGLNASSEGEIMVYDDSIGAYQERLIRPPLTRVTNFEMLSLFGEVDPEIGFVFNPLRVMTEKEKSEIQKAEGERDKTYIDAGVLAPEEVRKRVIDDPELPYADLDPDDVPDLAAEEEEGLEPEGGRPDPKAEGEPDKEEGGGANDAAPFGLDATGATFSEADHPRRTDGKFGSGGGTTGSTSALIANATKVLKTHAAQTQAWLEGKTAGEVITAIAKHPKAKDAISVGLQGILNHFAGLDASTWKLTEDTIDHAVHHIGDVTGVAAGAARQMLRSTVEALIKHRSGAMDAEEGDGVLAVLRAILEMLEDDQAEDAEFREADHPRAPDGKFGTGSGGGASPSEAKGGNTEPGGLLELMEKAKPGAGGGPKAKGDVISELLKRGATTKDILGATGWKAINVPRVALALGLKIEKNGNVYKGVPMSPDELKAARAEAARLAGERKKAKEGGVAPPPVEIKPPPMPAEVKPPPAAIKPPPAPRAPGPALKINVSTPTTDPGGLESQKINQFAARVEKGANALPDAHRALVADVPINVVQKATLTNTVVGGNYAGVFMSGVGNGRAGRVELPQMTQSGWHMRNEENTIAHELGHAIDFKTGWNLGPLVASQVDEDAKGMTTRERDRAKYWFTNDKERFAELYALTYAGRGESGAPSFYGGMTRLRAQRIFAKSIEVMKSLKIGEPGGAYYDQMANFGKSKSTPKKGRREPWQN